MQLNQDETVVAEAGAMTYFTPNIEAKTRMRSGGILSSLGMTLLGRQSFFVNDYTARTGPGKIGLVSAPVGDIERLEVTPDHGFVIQKSSYVASSPQVQLNLEWEGFTKGIFGQGLFMIKTSGSGDLFINTFGAIDKHTLGAGESLVVDNFHLVAFTEGCKYRVTKFGGLKETILGGEGLVTEVTGPGEIYIQTKNLREFVDWLWTLLEPRVQSRAR